MKPIITRWLTPCLAVSLYFADFTQAEAANPAQGKRPVARQVQRPQAQRQVQQRQVQRPQAQRQVQKPQARRAAAAPGKRAVASAPQRKGAPQVRSAAVPKRAPNPAVVARSNGNNNANPAQRRQAPKQLVGATSPEEAKVAQERNQPKSTPAPAPRQMTPAAPAQQPQRDNQAENAAAARARQAERVQDNQQRVRENQADAQKQQAERAQRADDNRQQQVQQNQEILRQRQQEAQERAQQNKNVAEERQQQNAKAAQERVEQNREAAQQRLKENADANAQNAADRQAALRQRAEDNQARVKANQDQAQDRVREAQERAQDARAANQERAQNAQERIRDAQAANQERVRDARDAAQDRMRDAQDRVRENQANNQQRIAEAQSRLRLQQGERATAMQERIRDAQERSRQAQADLRERQFANVQDRRAAFDNARLLAAQAHRPLIERANMNFRPGWTEARDPGWQSRWGNTWAQAAEARAANRIAGNYQRAVNWSYRPNYWGSNPWWAGNANRGNWNRGYWAYGWNRPWFQRNYWYAPAWSGYYDDSSNVANGIAWGLAAWGMGNLIYDSGYENYYNPYPVSYAYQDTSFAYDQPITEIATRYPSGDDDQAKTSAAKSNAAFERSRGQFKDEDYVAALKSADEAISYTPGDSSLHEYRALVFFALGQYGNAAGVLNTVLASSPGWDYKTMVAFYSSEDAYNNQLAKLETYVDAKPDAADARFVLGYHYLVAGELDRAATRFDEVAQLQPRDSVAKQLRDLARSSVKSPEANSEPVEGNRDRDAAAEPIDTDRLVGDWTSDRGASSKVTLDMKNDGHFTWTFQKSGSDSKVLEGTYSIDDRGLLVLNSQDSQMVGEISMPQDNQLVFVLAGGPEGDPGLKFSKD